MLPSCALASSQALALIKSHACRRDQELADAYIEKLSAIEGLDKAEHEQLKKQQIEKHERIDETILPGYMKKLTSGYEYRT